MQMTSMLAAAALAGLTIAAPVMEKREPFNGLYTIRAFRQGAIFDNLEINAAGQHFYVAPGGSPAAYCPTSVGSACPNVTDTVWASSALVSGHSF